MKTPSKVHLSDQSIKELNHLLCEVPPKVLVQVLTKLYMLYFADNASELDTEFRQFYEPLYKLIVVLEKVEMTG